MEDAVEVEEKMTPEERRLRPEHHVVHDYANLVSSWRLRDPVYIAQLLNIPTANGHAWHAFYMNCRKMYEFFTYQRSKTYLTAQQFVKRGVAFTFQHWTDDVQKFMNTHMLHVGGGGSRTRRLRPEQTTRSTSVTFRTRGKS
jgi:hypothetical protein